MTEYAVSKYHIQTQLPRWLFQALPRSLPRSSAPYGNSGTPTRCGSRPRPTTRAWPSSHGATALGIVIALSVLAMSVGLIWRTITAATAAALGLLGMAGVVIAGIARTHSGLTATADGVPPSDLLILLIGLPLVAAIGGWLFAGREPPAVARQPLE
jgi:hypothetical protein